MNNVQTPRATGVIRSGIFYSSLVARVTLSRVTTGNTDKVAHKQNAPPGSHPPNRLFFPTRRSYSFRYDVSCARLTRNFWAHLFAVYATVMKQQKTTVTPTSSTDRARAFTIPIAATRREISRAYRQSITAVERFASPKPPPKI